MAKQTVKTKNLQTFTKAIADVNEKAARIAAYRKEASRLASMANKRIERLERRDLTSSHAYQKYIKNGQPRFGIRGKSYNEVQQEVAKMERFLAAQTSTVKGVNDWLKRQADITGLKYESLKQMQRDAGKFYELFNKTQQYLQQVEDIGSAFDSDEIMETISVYVKEGEIDFKDSSQKLEHMIKRVTDALKEQEQPVKVGNDGWFSLK